MTEVGFEPTPPKRPHANALRKLSDMDPASKVKFDCSVHLERKCFLVTAEEPISYIRLLVQGPYNNVLSQGDVKRIFHISMHYNNKHGSMSEVKCDSVRLAGAEFTWPVVSTRCHPPLGVAVNSYISFNFQKRMECERVKLAEILLYPPSFLKIEIAGRQC